MRDRKAFGKWNAVGVKLPPTREPVLVAYTMRSGGGRDIAQYSGGQWFHKNGGRLDRPVVYWRTLPEVG